MKSHIDSVESVFIYPKASPSHSLVPELDVIPSQPPNISFPHPFTDNSVMWLGSFPCHASLLVHVRARLGEGGGLGAGGADDAHPGSVSNQTTSGREVQVRKHEEYVQN